MMLLLFILWFTSGFIGIFLITFFIDKEVTVGHLLLFPFVILGGPVIFIFGIIRMAFESDIAGKVLWRRKYK